MEQSRNTSDELRTSDTAPSPSRSTATPAATPSLRRNAQSVASSLSSAASSISHRPTPSEVTGRLSRLVKSTTKPSSHRTKKVIETLTESSALVGETTSFSGLQLRVDSSSSTATVSWYSAGVVTASLVVPFSEGKNKDQRETNTQKLISQGVAELLRDTKIYLETGTTSRSSGSLALTALANLIRRLRSLHESQVRNL